MDSSVWKNDIAYWKQFDTNKLTELGEVIEVRDFVRAYVDQNGKILWGIKTDGDIFFAIGTPTQIIDYVNKEKKSLEKEDTIIKNSIKELGFFVENASFIRVVVDSDNKILWGIKKDGSVFYGAGLPEQIKDEFNKIEERIPQYFDCNEYAQIVLSDNGRIIEGVKKDGTKYIAKLESPIVDELEKKIPSTQIIEDIVKDKIASIDDSLPEYYQENNYLNNKVEQINSLFLNSGVKSDIFAFFTDGHYVLNALKTPLILKYLIKQSCVRKVFYGGDASSVNTSKDVFYFEVNEELKIANEVAAVGRYFGMKGNHDFYNRFNDPDASHQTTKRYPNTAPYNLIMQNTENVEVGDEDGIGCYYYFDEKSSNIRYIILDTHYNTAGVTMTDKQLDWLANTLLNTPTGYDNILFSHVGIERGVHYDEGEYESLRGCRDIVNAYQNKGTVTINGKVYNYTDCLGKIIMCVNGHGHQDMQTYHNGILYVSTPCDSLYADESSSYMRSVVPYKKRVIDSINEQCFDVLIIDKSNSRINTIRIGNGFDRTFNTRVINLNVGQSVQLTSILPDTISWKVMDAISGVRSDTIGADNEYWHFSQNVCSVNNGNVSAQNRGESVVCAISSTGNKEFFNIKVK